MYKGAGDKLTAENANLGWNIKMWGKGRYGIMFPSYRSAGTSLVAV